MYQTNIRVYVDGVFDLFHYGHVRLFKQVKEYFETKFPNQNIHIISGVITDEDVMKYKRKPIMTFDERKEVLESCKYIHQVVDGELYITDEFLNTHKVDYVVHGNDSSQSDFYKIPIEKGIMVYLKYTNTISTTNIINRIKN